jgi:hypothetical protein
MDETPRDIKHNKHVIRCRFCHDAHSYGRGNCDYCKGAGWVTFPGFTLHYTPASHKPHGPCWSWMPHEGGEISRLRIRGEFAEEDTAYFAACNATRRPATLSERMHAQALYERGETE